jgi:hypothetical protein
VKRAAFVKIETLDSFTGQQQLVIHHYPFSTDRALALCHLCTRDNVKCDLGDEELAEVTVVECEVREILAPLLEE